MATPDPIVNRPALDAIGYRVGTYATFRRTMLEALSRAERPAEAPGGEATHPLRPWKTRTSDDFGIAFVEMWAYLGDILTFYQERIANEAFLRTGVHADSTTWAVSLIGYRPSAGRAASTLLAFETEKTAVDVPEGLRVQSVPGQDEKPQKFETVEALRAHPGLNVLRPRTTGPQTLPLGARRAVLKGVGLALEPGDWIAVVGDERRDDPGSERWDVRRLATVAEDSEAGTTTVAWDEGLGSYPRPWRGAILPASDPEIWVFRQQAWPFGYNAPDHRIYTTMLPPEQVTTFTAAFPNWNAFTLPEDTDHPDHLYLDSVYEDVVPGGWVALSTARVEHDDIEGYPQYVELYPVVEAAETAWTNYTLSAKVTRITLDTTTTQDEAGEEVVAPEHIHYFPVRGTVAHVASERLELAEVPIGHSAVGASSPPPTPVSGDRIELDRVHPELHVGRTLLVTGQRLDASGDPAGEGVEAVTVRTVAHEEGHTVITFAPPLAHAFARGSVLIHGNVASATHGEGTDETLGDGDAAEAFQRFVLSDGPVTHVPRSGAPGGAASTLEIRVNGVRWEQRRELHGEPGDARVYVTRRNARQETTVVFGDGRTGSRLTSGRENVEAFYRVGLGPQGNVAARSLRTLLDKPLGLKRVTNPVPAVGGTAPEDPASVKETAPGTVRTFGRVVSLQDFVDAAREYVGIAKARATWRWDGEGQVVDLVVAGEEGAPVGALLGDLQADLDARRDPHRPLRISEFTRVPVSVRLDLLADEAHRLEDVEAAAAEALHRLFDFDRLALGGTVHLSDVHRDVQRVAGVVAVIVQEFRFKHAADRVGRGGDDAVQPRLLVAPGEMAWVEEPGDLRIVDVRFGGRRTS